MTLLAVAALSARALSDAAVAEGHTVLALDLFGDTDTRQAAQGWQRIGDPAALALDGEALRAGLQWAAAQGVQAWLAGSGFEPQPELLHAAPAGLPFLGTPAPALVRLRDPLQFFAVLAALDVPHPAVASEVPAQPEGWLVKHARGSGGGHVRPARPGERALPPQHYAQRRAPGVPMSATFVANGQAAVLLGFNRQTVLGHGQFTGAVGPVVVPPAVRRTVQRALQGLVAEFGVLGLGSLDFLCEGEQVQVLELNARPPATLALYPHWQPVSLHLAACAHRQLPAAAPPPAAGPAVRGLRIVHAPQDSACSAAMSEALSRLEAVHDRPAAGELFPAGAPVCSLSAQADDAAAVLALLDARQAHVHHLLETLAP